VVSVEALGHSLVLFRGRDSGRFGLLDTYCPHVGASFVAGGEVVGDELRCPFHRWRFQTDGCLSHVPYLEPTPRIKARSWPVRVVHGMVWMFHQHGGAPVGPPAYEPEPKPDILDGTLAYRGEHDGGFVRMHVAEFAENSVDMQHFDPLHGQMIFPWTTVPVPGVRVHHDAHWSTDPHRPHVAYFKNHAALKIRGRVLESTAADAVITFFGPGGITDFRFTIPGYGDVVLFQTHTPVEPLKLRVRFKWFANPRIPRMLVSYVVGNWVGQWKADIDIWETKVFLRQPKLVRGDGPVHRMRRWYGQFYQDPPQTVVASGSAQHRTIGLRSPTEGGIDVQT